MSGSQRPATHATPAKWPARPPHGGVAVRFVRPTAKCRNVSLTAGSLVLLLLTTGCDREQKHAERPAPEVSTLAVTPTDVSVSWDFVAQAQSSQQVQIYARVTGFLDKRVYTEGAMVKANDVLFQMDARPYEVQLEGAQAALAQQQARLTTADAKLKRVRALAALNALSQKDLDNATGEAQTSAALVDQAKANVAQARLNLSYTTITSPVTGITAAAQQQDGTYIGELNTSLTNVAVLSPIWVNFSVSENQLLAIRREVASGALRGPPDDTNAVEVALPDGSVLPSKGQVSFRAPSFNSKTGTFLVRVTLDNPDDVLRPNQFLRARVLGFVRPDAILVPQRAVHQSARGHFVWVVNDKNESEFRPVVVGDWHGDDWFISDGLRAGDKVIVDGIVLQPGTLVKAEPVQAKPGAEVLTGSTTHPSDTSKK